MAYQAKRREVYEEDFQLLDEKGEVQHTFKVSLDADSIVRKLSEQHTELVQCCQKMQQVKNENALEVVGKAVDNILETVFGKEDAGTILDFYRHRYIEICQEVMPFVTEVVIPEVRKISQANKKLVKAKYNRKALQRR